MILKSISSLFVVVLISIVHAGCCLLPLFAAAAGYLPYFAGLLQYKTALTFIQLSILIYIGIRLFRYYFRKALFHSRLERASYQLGFLISVLSLYLGYFEPFKTENQRIAQQQFQFFKAHRHVEFGIAGKYDSRRLRKDIVLIDGIKADRVQIKDTTFSVTFQTKLISQDKIFNILRQKGYNIVLQE